MKRLLTYLKRHPLATLFAPLFKMLEASFELFVPLVVAKMIDIGIYQKMPDICGVWVLSLSCLESSDLVCNYRTVFCSKICCFHRTRFTK